MGRDWAGWRNPADRGRARLCGGAGRRRSPRLAALFCESSAKTREHGSAGMVSLQARSDREGAQDGGESRSLIDTMVQMLKLDPKQYSQPDVWGQVIARNPVWKQEVDTAGGLKAWAKKINKGAGVLWIDGPSSQMGGRLSMDLSQVLWPAGPGLLLRALPRRQRGH